MIRIDDVSRFKAVFQYVTKFINEAQFTVGPDGFEVRSVDPHDVCYVDLRFEPEFFDEYEVVDDWNFAVDVTKFSKIFPKISTSDPLEVEIDARYIALRTTDAWESTFRVEWLDGDPDPVGDVPEYDYDGVLNCAADDVADIVQKASTMADEVVFKAEDGSILLEASSGDYTYTARPIGAEELEIEGDFSTKLLIDYLKQLRSLMIRCDHAHLHLGEDTPTYIRLIAEEKGDFKFYLSPERQTETSQQKQTERKDRKGNSVPRISPKKFVDFSFEITQPGADPSVDALQRAGLETKGHDYIRMAGMLDLAYHDNGHLSATPLGEQLYGRHQQNTESERELLHEIAGEKIPAYRVMVNKLEEKPESRDSLFEKVNEELQSEHGYELHEDDLATLLGLARELEVVDKNMSLYSVEAAE
jgi:hypothetical protein